GDVVGLVQSSRSFFPRRQANRTRTANTTVTAADPAMIRLRSRTNPSTLPTSRHAERRQRRQRVVLALHIRRTEPSTGPGRTRTGLVHETGSSRLSGRWPPATLGSLGRFG